MRDFDGICDLPSVVSRRQIGGRSGTRYLIRSKPDVSDDLKEVKGGVGTSQDFPKLSRLTKMMQKGRIEGEILFQRSSRVLREVIHVHGSLVKVLCAAETNQRASLLPQILSHLHSGAHHTASSWSCV